MNLKLKRIGAYLIDYLFVVMLVSCISELRVVNPYYDDYMESYQEYVDFTNNIDLDNVNKLVNDNSYKKTFYNIAKYGVISNGISIGVYLLYFGGFQKWNKGQTLGKKLFKIRLVDVNGEDISWLQVLLRTIIMYNVIFNGLLILLVYLLKPIKYFWVSLSINALMNIVDYTLLLSLLIKKDDRGIHDLICKTKVVGI